VLVSKVFGNEMVDNKGESVLLPCKYGFTDNHLPVNTSDQSLSDDSLTSLEHSGHLNSSYERDQV
jgi:hypothetical protein